jgi:diguanylate cyclase (GGDEF)-like protein/PAS domain S-box-containing protein
VAEASDRLTRGLQELTAKLSAFAGDHPFTMVPNDPTDTAALRSLVDQSPFYATGLTTPGEVLLTAAATGPLPDPTDPGYSAMVQAPNVPPVRVTAQPSNGLLSSVMLADRNPVIAIGVVLLDINGQMRGRLVGWAALRDPLVRRILGTEADNGPLTSMVSFDRAGRVITAARTELIGMVDPAVLLSIDKGDTTPRMRITTVDGAPGVAFHVGAMPGDWSIIGSSRKADFYRDVRSRTRLVNLALLAIVVTAAVVLIVTGMRADRRVHRHQERFRALVQNSSDVIVVLDAGGDMLYASPTAIKLTGHGSGTAALNYVHPGDRRAVIAAFRAAQDAPGVVHRAEFRLRRVDGTDIWLDASVTDLRSSAAGGIVVNARDITDNRRLRERLPEQATVDALTGLGNRHRLYDDLGGALAVDRRPAVLYIDLDWFKPVNDRFGHEAGDELLRLVAARLTNCLRTGDALARIGGDEFVIVAPGLTGAGAEALAGRVVAALKEPFVLAATPAVRIGASVGVELAGPDDSPDDILRRADEAMYRAKQVRGTYAVTGAA